MDEFFRFWAVESLIDHSDGYAGNVNNFYLYHPPTSDKFAFIPWGADRVFYGSDSEPKSVIGVGILANHLYNSPGGRKTYRKTLQALLKTSWKEDRLLAEVDRLETLLAPHINFPTTVFKQSLEGVRRFIKTRRSDIQRELDGPAPELKSKPLEFAKRRNVGHVEGSFSTLWTKMDSPRQNSAGTAAVKGKLYDQELRAPNVSIQAGGLSSFSGNEKPAIIVRNEPANENERGFLVYLVVDPELYTAGATIPVDNTRIQGVFVELRGPGQGGRYIGLLKGSLTLRQAGRAPGESVEGEFKADVYSKYPQL